MEISSRGNHARRAASPQALLLLLLVDSVPMFEGLCEGAEEYFFGSAILSGPEHGRPCDPLADDIRVAVGAIRPPAKAYVRFMRQCDSAATWAA